jgi:hypothetical protein
VTLTNSINEKFSKYQQINCSLTAQNQFSTSVSGATPVSSAGTSGVLLYGNFTFKLTGTWVATVNVQRSSNNGITWDDVTTGLTSPTVLTFTTNGVFNGFESARDIIYRFGVKTSNYSSGTIVGEFEQ